MVYSSATAFFKHFVFAGNFFDSLSKNTKIGPNIYFLFLGTKQISDLLPSSRGCPQ
jgi:hypothetical protein